MHIIYQFLKTHLSCFFTNSNIIYKIYFTRRSTPYTSHDFTSFYRSSKVVPIVKQ